MTIDDSGAAPRTRIMVVDDHHDAANTLMTLLKVLGFEAQAAYSAAEALELIKTFRPHCVLSDIEMPGMTGYQLAETIRREAEFKDIPLIAISGNCDPALAEAAGFNYYLTKPAPPVTLTSLLRKVCHMDDHLERAERMVEAQGRIVGEARELMQEVKGDVKEIKSDLEELKQDVKELKDDLRDAKSEATPEPSE